MQRTLLLVVACVAVALGLAHAGSFIFAEGTTARRDIITHPEGYTGGAGTLSLKVCIDPASVNGTEMLIPLTNAVNTWNGLAVTTGNLVVGGANNVPAGSVDFESTLLHELGHCIGLGHPNLGSDPGVTAGNDNLTKSGPGTDATFSFGAGTDGIKGSADDARGDDVNLHWFRRSSNNPLTIAPTVDSTTYARDTGDLPGDDSFAANADRAVAAALGFADTEAVMQQGQFVDEAQRSLVADGVATLRYGMAGLDELAGSGGDDYTIDLIDGGISSTACDITLDFDDESDPAPVAFAACIVTEGTFALSDHRVANDPEVRFNPDFAWFFNDELPAPTPTITPAPATTPDPNAAPTPTPGGACGGPTMIPCPDGTGYVCVEAVPLAGGTCEAPTATATVTPTTTSTPAATVTPAAGLTVTSRGPVTIRQGQTGVGGTFRITSSSGEELSISSITIDVSRPGFFEAMRLRGEVDGTPQNAEAMPPTETTVFAFPTPLVIPAGETAQFTLEVTAIEAAQEEARRLVLYATIVPLSGGPRGSAVALAVFGFLLFAGAGTNRRVRRLGSALLLLAIATIATGQTACGGGGSFRAAASDQTIEGVTASSGGDPATVTGLPADLGAVRVRGASVDE